ncbi:hypothetical protein WN943_028494 [Citrus x changshan-huyou]
MASPQAHQSNKLVRVGMEGFVLLEEIYSFPKKSGGMLSGTQSCDDHRQYPGLRGPVIDSSQAARLYGGMARQTDSSYTHTSLMALPQARQTDRLVRIGREGFDLLDELYGRPKKHGGKLPPTQSYNHHHQYTKA